MNILFPFLVMKDKKCVLLLFSRIDLTGLFPTLVPKRPSSSPPRDGHRGSRSISVFAAQILANAQMDFLKDF